MHEEKNIVEELKKLLADLKEKEQPRWLDGSDLMRMLHMCPKTLRRLRVDHKLPYTELNGKIYYSRQDVDDMMMKHRKE